MRGYHGQDIIARREASGRGNTIGSPGGSPEEPYLKKYFAPTDGGNYKFQDQYKININFRKFNLMEFDSIPINVSFDVLFCLYILIYFDRDSKQKVVDSFYSKMAPGGYLILGNSESLFSISNSAIYSKRQEITNLSNAITFLGTTTTRNLILQIALVRLFNPEDEEIPDFSIDTFWEHSLGTAYFTEIIVKKLKLPPNHDYYIAGLLHDIGKLVIYQFYPELKKIKFFGVPLCLRAFVTIVFIVPGCCSPHEELP